MSHDVKCVVGMDIYSGLYCGGVSFDVSHSDAPVLALFKGITTGAATVDLHFSACSHNRSVRGLLSKMCRMLFHHSLVDVYGHVRFFCSSPANVAYQACCLFIVEHGMGL